MFRRFKKLTDLFPNDFRNFQDSLNLRNMIHWMCLKSAMENRNAL